MVSEQSNFTVREAAQQCIPMKLSLTKVELLPLSPCDSLRVLLTKAVLLLLPLLEFLTFVLGSFFKT